MRIEPRIGSFLQRRRILAGVTLGAFDPWFHHRHTRTTNSGVQMETRAGAVSRKRPVYRGLERAQHRRGLHRRRFPRCTRHPVRTFAFASWKWCQLLWPLETRSPRMKRKTADRACLRYRGCIERRLSWSHREPPKLFNASDASKQRFAHL